jgi:hypothetical protein
VLPTAREGSSDQGYTDDGRATEVTHGRNALHPMHAASRGKDDTNQRISLRRAGERSGARFAS